MRKIKMTSYVDRANKLIQAKNTPAALKMTTSGLSYYSERILKAINPYATADAGLLAFVLRHLADEIEKQGGEGAKILAAWLGKNVNSGEVKFDTRIEKPNTK